MANDGMVLFSADTDKIKEYVFESAKLPEIRGASMILDDLNYQRLPKLVEKRRGEVIYRGGGSLLALVPAAEAEALQQEIEELYPSETGTATITCVYRPVTNEECEHGPSGFTHAKLLELKKGLAPSDWRRVAAYYPSQKASDGDAVDEEAFERRRCFGELVALLGILLRREKERKRIAPLFEAIPFARRCEACGMRPAQFVDGRYLCGPCELKFGRKERRERKGLWTRRFAEFCANENVQVDTQTPRDLTELGDDIAFIYADGNEVGRWLESSRRKEDYEARSKALRQATEGATYAALVKHLRGKAGPDGRVPVRPFEIVSIGGDDLVLIAPAQGALLVAEDICREFERRLKALAPPDEGKTGSKTSLTMSAGVAIANCHTPIYFLRNLAAQLLKSAKKGAHESGKGTVDFLVLKSETTLATELSHRRKNPPVRYVDPLRGEELRLTGLPYTLDDLDKLIATAQDLRALASTQVEAYRRVLHRGRLRATLYFLYQYARADKDVRCRLGQAYDRWRSADDKFTPPWFALDPLRGHERFWTPWEDAAQIMDFVPNGSTGMEGGEARESGH